MRPTLINFPPDQNNLFDPVFAVDIKQYFNTDEFNPAIQYDKRSTVFCLNLIQYNQYHKIVDQLINNNHYVIFENLHEARPFDEKYLSFPNVLFLFAAKKNQFDQKNVLQIPMYFWYKESRDWTNRGYNQLTRSNKCNKKFLMLINDEHKSFRTSIYNKFENILDNALYSFVSRGIRLPNDIDPADVYWDRHVDIDWYNATQFSVVIETFMHSGAFGNVFITEKTMKPIAFQHPFVILGNPTTLNKLQSVGFVTFENLFDEHYDTVIPEDKRIESVYNQVKNYKATQYDQLTQEKIKHNFNWFYNDAEIKRRYKLEIIDPIMEFING